MFEIFRDSLFDPKKIISFQKKKTSTFILYLLLLALFMSTGIFIYYFSFNSNSEITSETTGCEIIDGAISCTGSNHDLNDSFTIYNYTFYFLDASDNVDDINMFETEVIVFQSSSLYLYQNGNLYFTWSSKNLLEEMTDFDSLMNAFSDGILFVSVFIGYLSNLFVITIIILISALSFNIYRQFIKFGVLFKLVGFGSTAVAAVLAFNRLISMPSIIFLLLLFGSYYPLYFLRRSIVMNINNIVRKQMPLSSVQSETEIEDENSEDEEK